MEALLMPSPGVCQSSQDPIVWGPQEETMTVTATVP